jgi:serine phosphatase RsbU (regulator of sigma subunit)
LRYANCGHLSALILRRNNTFLALESNSTVLGLFEDWKCSIEEQQLFPGDTLALYTDGITESSTDAGEEFGEQRLREVLQQRRGLGPQPLLKAVFEEVRRFNPNEQQDDITLIVANSLEACNESHESGRLAPI